MTLVVDGTVAKVDPILQNGVTYVPLRAAAELLGATVNLDSKTNTVTVTSKGTTVTPASNNSKTIGKVTVTINKVTQDADSLKVYVTYINKSDKAVSPAESLSKIVSNGKQYDYDTMFNFDRYYDTGVDNASGSLEPGVTAKSVLFFPPVANPTKINILVQPNYEEFRFNDIVVGK